MSGKGVPQKRARPSSRAPAPSQPREIIEIFSDDSDTARPQTKRHKSTTPLTNVALTSALLSSFNAKPATSGAQTAKSKSVTLQESQPDRRDSSHSKQNGYKAPPISPFKTYPPLEARSHNGLAAQSTDPSGVVEKLFTKPSSSPSQRPDSWPRQPRHTESRSSSSSVAKSRVSTPDTSALDKQSSNSLSRMRDPKYFDFKEKTKRVSSTAEGSMAEGKSLEDEYENMKLLERFQNPSRAMPSAHSKKFKEAAHSSMPQSNVEVSVPLRPTPTPSKSQRPKALPSIMSPNFSLNVPLSQYEDPSSPSFAAKKKALFKELEQSTDVAKERLPEVEKYFGQTGFSKAFSTTNDQERRDRAAPVYKRKVDAKKFFEETDFDELWKEMQLEAGTPAEEVTKWNLEINDPIDLDDDSYGSDFDDGYDTLLNEIMDENFSRHPDPPLSFKNDINDRRIYGMFQFMGEYVIREGIKVAPASNNRGCSCKGQCIPETCACLHKQVPIDPFDPSNKQTFKKTIKTYCQSPKEPSVTVLHPDFITNELKAENAHYEITECNEVCGCGPDCWNRVVGRGRTLSLEIYMTERCGFGVRYPHGDILKGQFIDVYLGEVITQQEVEKREDAKHPDAPSYVYSLDWFNIPPVYHVDGEYFGSPMRFVNHSCSPNARSFSVQTHQGDKHVYHLAFFAIRDIPAGEQITIDYCPQEAIADDDSDDDINPFAAITATALSTASSVTNNSKNDVAVSGAPSVEPEDEVRSTAGSRSTRSSKSSKSSQSKGKGNGKASEVVRAKKPKPALPVPATPIVEEEGRSRCYCGAPNCRVWMWRKGGRRSRKKRNI